MLNTNLPLMKRLSVHVGYTPNTYYCSRCVSLYTSLGTQSFAIVLSEKGIHNVYFQ